MGDGCSHSTDCVTIVQAVTSRYRTKEPTSSSCKSYVTPYIHRLPRRKELSGALAWTKPDPCIKHIGLFLIPRVWMQP